MDDKLGISIALDDVQKLVESDPVAGLKLSNITLARTVRELRAQVEVLQAEIDCFNKVKDISPRRNKHGDAKELEGAKAQG